MAFRRITSSLKLAGPQRILTTNRGNQSIRHNISLRRNVNSTKPIEPVKEHRLEPVKEHRLEPVKEHRLEPVKEHRLEPLKEIGKPIQPADIEITFKNVLKNITTFEKSMIIEEFIKNITFYKIIDDFGYPLVGFILQQLERAPNKDFKNYIDLMRKIGIKNIRNEMKNLKNHKTNIIKLHRALLKLRTPGNKVDIDEIIKIHKKYKYDNIIKNIDEFLNNKKNILDTLSYFVLVIGIKIICSIIIVSVTGFSLYNILKNTTRVDDEIGKTTPEFEDTETLSDDETKTISSQENVNKEITGKITELSHTFFDKKYITFIRKLPGLILLFVNLNQAIDELEPGTNVELNELLEQLELSDEAQIVTKFKKMQRELSETDGEYSKALFEGISPLIEFIEKQGLSEINNTDLVYYGIDTSIKIPVNPDGIDQNTKLEIEKVLNLLNFYTAQFPDMYIEYKLPKLHTLRYGHHKSMNRTSKAINRIEEGLKPKLSNNTLRSLLRK